MTQLVTTFTVCIIMGIIIIYRGVKNKDTTTATMGVVIISLSLFGIFKYCI